MATLWAKSKDKIVLARWNEALSGQHELVSVGRDRSQNLSQGTLLLDFASRDEVRSLLSEHPNLKILAFYGAFNVVAAVSLFREGVRAYCNRYISSSKLRRVLEVVLAGEVWVGEQLMSQLVILQQLYEPAEDGTDKALSTLTTREYEILQWVLKGVPNKKIALGLGLTERTVKAHVRAILHKYGATDRLQLVLRFRNRSPGY